MADVTISDVNTLISFINGNYGRGASGTPITAELTADIDFSVLEGYTWTGDTSTTAWYIEFYGNNHKIKNISATGVGDWWFLCNIAQGFVQDIWIESINVSASGNASIFNQIRSTTIVKNIHVTGRIKGNTVAGICISSSSANTRVRECSFNGTLQGVNIAGIAYNTVSTTGSNRIVNCSFVGNMIATQNASGLAYTTGYCSGSFVRATIQAATIYPLVSGANRCNECYVVLYAGTTGTIQSVTQAQCLYDSTIADQAGLVIGGISPALTSELQDATFMREAGFAI